MENQRLGGGGGGGWQKATNPEVTNNSKGRRDFMRIGLLEYEGSQIAQPFNIVNLNGDSWKKNSRIKRGNLLQDCPSLFSYIELSNYNWLVACSPLLVGHANYVGSSC